MRNITKSSYDAFIKRKPFSRSNTSVVIDNNGDAYMYLFGNLIAKTEGNDVLINHCGYTTATTRERLSAFGITIRIMNGQFIVNEDFMWKDGWININLLR